MLLTLLALFAPAVAACAVPRTVAELDARLLAAEMAWSDGAAAFAETTAGTADLLDCVNAPLPVATVGRLLRLEGLAAFARREMPDSAAAFAGARLADPSLTLDDTYAGEGHPLRALWDTPAKRGAPVALRPPLRGALYVNGAPSRVGPRGVPFVLQWIDGVEARGAVTTPSTLPSYPRAPHPARNPLFGVAGAAALAGGVLYGLAWVEHDRAFEAGDLATLDGAIEANHTYSAAAAGAGGVAVFALAGAIVVARW